MVWFVKGWIVEWNGHSINWAKAIVTIAKEKAQHLGTNTINKPKMEKSLTNVNEGSQRSQEGIGLGFAIVKLKKGANFFYVGMPFTKPMSNEDISKLEEVLELNNQFGSWLMYI
jgi:hypothetical protein